MRYLAILSCICGVLLIGAPAAMASTDGLAYTEDTIFTVQDDRVDVVTVAVMANTTAERESGDTIFYSFFDTFSTVIPVGAFNLSIESDALPLESSATPIDDDFEVRTVRLPGELGPGQSRSFIVTYSLPVGEFRGDGLFFSNPAFHAFALWSLSDPGTGSLVLRVPEEMEMAEFGETLRRTGVSDGLVEWEPQDFDVPEDFFTYVTVNDDTGLEVDTFTVSDQQIELRTWPGDDEWASFATRTIRQGLPELEDQIGVPVPDQETLEVTESITPYLEGYAGWYDQQDTSIEIGNEFDDTALVHELSHAWFNDTLFADRWIAEGLAEEFTWRVQSELGWDTERLPSRPDRDSEFAAPLTEWNSFQPEGVDDEGFRDREEYGYTTSWYVVRELVDIIGIDDVRATIEAAHNETTAYPANDVVARTPVQPDWRRLLDLASVGATDDQELALDELFIDYVVGPDDVADLEVRRVVRNQYREFAARETDWDIPVEIRLAMERWQFADASELMTAANEVQDRYDELSVRAQGVDLVLSDAAQISYERNAPDFALAHDVLDDQAMAISHVEAIRESASRELTSEEQWGLRDVSLAPFAVHAETAFFQDDVSRLNRIEQSLSGLLASASRAGAGRILWARIGAGATAATMVFGAWMFLARRRIDAEAPIAG